MNERIAVILDYKVRGLAALKTAAVATRQAGTEATKFATTQSAAQKALGRTALIAGGVLVAGLGVAAAASIKFESAFAGVLKTVDGTTAQLDALRQGILDMSKRLPASATEIAAVAEAAGQLGVETENVLSFTETMIALGESTNLSATEAATALARFANITGTSTDQSEKLGSTLVALGNNSATTEAEILTLATRMAAAGTIAGLSADEILSIAAAMSSVGVEAEAGGTAFSQIINSMRDSVLRGGEELETFATIAGTTADEFAQTFRTDPALALQEFVLGIGRANDAGISLSDAFADLGLGGERVGRTMNSLAEAGELMGESVELGSDAFRDGTALAEEAGRRYATTASQIEIARNRLTAFAIEIGDRVTVALSKGIEFVQGMGSALGALSPEAKTAATAIAGATAGLLLLGGATLSVLPRLARIKDSLAAFPTLTRAIRVLGPAAGVAAAGLAIGALAAIQLTKSQREAAARADRLREALEGVTGSTEGAVARFGELVGVLEDANSELDEAGLKFENVGKQFVVDELGDLIDEFTDLGLAVEDVFPAIESGSDGFQRFAEILVGATALGDEFAGAIRDRMTPETEAFGEALIAAFEGGDVGLDVLRNITDRLDEAADGFDDTREAVENDAREFLAAAVALGKLDDQMVNSAIVRHSLQDRTTAHARAAEELLPLIEDQTDATQEAAAADREYAEAKAQFEQDLAGFKDTADDVVDSEGEMADGAGEVADATYGMADALEEAEQRLQEAGDAIRDYFGTITAASNSALAFHDAIDTLNDTIIDNGLQLDISTEKGRDQQRQVNSLIDAIADQVAATFEQTGSAEAAQEAGQALIDTWVAEAEAAGLTAEQIAAIKGQIDTIPAQVLFAIVAEGINEAQAALDNVLSKISQIDGREVRTSIVTELVTRNVSTPGAITTPTGEQIVLPGVPERQSGGLVRAGNLYRVNEAGLESFELFAPALGGRVITALGQSGGGQAKRFANLLPNLRALRTDLAKTAIENIKVTGTLDRLRMAHDRVGDTAEALADRFERQRAAAQAMREEVDRGAAAVLALVSGINEGRDRTIAFEEAVDRLNESIIENGQTLDLSTEAGRDNQRAVNSLRSAVAELVAAEFERTESVEASVAVGREAIAEWRAQAQAAGLGIGETRRIVAELAGLPRQAAAAINLSGFRVAAEIENVVRRSFARTQSIGDAIEAGRARVRRIERGAREAGLTSQQIRDLGGDALRELPTRIVQEIQQSQLIDVQRELARVIERATRAEDAREDRRDAREERRRRQEERERGVQQAGRIIEEAVRQELRRTGPEGEQIGTPESARAVGDALAAVAIAQLGAQLSGAQQAFLARLPGLSVAEATGTKGINQFATELINALNLALTGRQFGGPVAPGRLYRVNELAAGFEGFEVFNPATGGRIVTALGMQRLAGDAARAGSRTEINMPVSVRQTMTVDDILDLRAEAEFLVPSVGF